MSEPSPSRTHDPYAFSELFPLIFGAIGVTAMCLLIFLPHSSKNDDDDENPPEDFNEENSELQNVFAVSGHHFSSVQETWRNAEPEGAGWLSYSGTHYASQNTGFRNLVGQIAELNHQADTAVRTEDEQVHNGRATLENVLGELHAAIPVAESLYVSGPAGPALSYNFQMAVANSAVGTATDTTNDMHENSTKHAETLTALAQQYNETLSRIPGADSAVVPVRPAPSVEGILHTA